ncbi:MAG: hypothetical protein E7199_03625 [Schwartzia succinivorans]|nr:hypothetical protein [Schwartzia succinivorans]
MEEANDIFFSTLEQYATEASAGAAIAEAVAAALAQAPELAALPEAETQKILRWFSDRPRDERVQILALAEGVKKHKAGEEGRSEMRKRPAESRLEHLELAAAIYRHLKRKKTAVAAVVESTNIQTKAAYTALVSANLGLINQMRSVQKTRNWTKISETLQVLTGKKIPPTTLSKVYSEITSGIVVRLSEQVTPQPMAHFLNEHIDQSTRKAYEKAGFDTSGEAVPWQGQETKRNEPATDEPAGAQRSEEPVAEENLPGEGAKEEAEA